MAVDGVDGATGDKRASHQPFHCTHTDLLSSDSSQWWAAKLDKKYSEVHIIKIYKRTDVNDCKSVILLLLFPTFNNEIAP